MLLFLDDGRAILDCTESSELYPDLENTLQGPEADEALSRNRTRRVCRAGPTRPLEKTARVNISILIITELFTEMSRCIPPRNTKATTATTAFPEYPVYVYSASVHPNRQREADRFQFFRLRMQNIGLQTPFHRSLTSADKRARRAVQYEDCAATLTFREGPFSKLGPVPAAACVFLQYASAPNNADDTF